MTLGAEPPLLAPKFTTGSTAFHDLVNVFNS
jgi:hypothetical protein